ncbi:MAG: ABC transporter permease subunit [Thermoplasmata archaeon]
MKPIVYEIRRTLTSKFVIIMMIAIVGLSALLAYETASTSTSVGISSQPSVSFGYFINGNNLTMVAYAHDSYGNPVSRVNVYYQYNGTEYIAVSSSNGYANSTFPVVKAPQILIETNYSYRQFGNRITSPSAQYMVNFSSYYSGLQIIPDIVNPSNTSNLGFMVMYIGQNGTPSPPITIIVKATDISSKISDTSNFTYYYNMSSISIAKIYPTISSDNRNMSFLVSAEAANGMPLMLNTGIGKFTPFIDLFKLSIYTPITQSRLQNLVFSGAASILGLFIPILAIFVGYLTYGKDRTSGVLESVLKRPVTRGELITTRFISNALAILIAGSLAMIITDIIYNHYLHMYFSLLFLIDLIWTYLVEGVAFLALVYLISHVVKSQGALLGAAIGIFVVMDLFWGIIPIAVISALGISSTSSSYVTVNILFDYVSPAGYSNLVQSLITGKLGSFGGISINPSTYGITDLALAISGFLWMMVPFALAYILARYRD